MHVLVVEDDPKIASHLQQGLQSSGHQAQSVAAGEPALRLALERPFDLILLDLMLPDLSGYEVLRRLRESDCSTPVFVLTARGGIDDKVQGLDLGADDYLVKPFSIVELQARIRAFFRRAQPDLVERVLRVGALTLDQVERKVEHAGKHASLTEREYQLLAMLMRNPDTPLTRAVLSDRVWGYSFDTGTNVVDVYVSYLRKKLADLGLRPIRTVRGIGYALDSASCA
ncbi:MAG: response regulator transcription factor [Planctomycetes bacterium]|nr:response regulator transcription factor [Planctomycetota bacterium]